MHELIPFDEANIRIRKLSFGIVTLVIPYLILMGCVMLVFTSEFLLYEYSLADFPADPYGFSAEERAEYGAASLEYIITWRPDKNPDALRNLQMGDGTPLYNERELSHMEDVQKVFQNARIAFFALLAIFALISYKVLRHKDRMAPYLKSLLRGGLLSLALMAAAIVFMLTGFDAFFTQFHQLFFSEGSWLFYANDSLIRLYPEKLWVDGFRLAGILAAVVAGFLVLIASLALRKLSASPCLQKKSANL